MPKKLRANKAKIYYGPPGDEDLFWSVKVRESSKGVRLNGSIADAMAGEPGLTIGCHLSNCAQRNSKAFPHPALMASFTKTTALIVTKIKNGVPVEAVRYYHPYGYLVDLNDTDKTKKYLKEHPELAEKSFYLRPSISYKKKGSQPTGRATGPRTGAKRAYAPRGAVRRALKAGLLNEGVAGAIKKMVSGNKSANPNTPTIKLARKTLSSMTGFKSLTK